MVSGKQFALTAIKRRHLGITYKQEMCDAYVERTLEAAGGPYINYAGSNTMLREAVTELVPLSEAQRMGILQPGMVLFIVKYDGQEPAKFRADGLGNADHIGVFTGTTDPDTGEYIEVMHSSASRGGVYPSTLKNAWTHAAKYKNVSYGGSDASGEAPTGGGTEMIDMVVTVASGTTVNLRKKPSTGDTIVLERVPSGTVVRAQQHNGLWHYVITPKGNRGYVMSEFLGDTDGSSSAPDGNQNHGVSDGDMVMVNRGMLYALWQELGIMLGE